MHHLLNCQARHDQGQPCGPSCRCDCHEAEAEHPAGSDVDRQFEELMERAGFPGAERRHRIWQVLRWVVAVVAVVAFLALFTWLGAGATQ